MTNLKKIVLEKNRILNVATAQMYLVGYKFKLLFEGSFLNIRVTVNCLALYPYGFKNRIRLLYLHIYAGYGAMAI